MNKLYEKELSDLKYKMIKAEKFAKKLPLFSDKIIRDKITGDNNFVDFGETYKNLHCRWGIGRGLYETGTNRTLTNYGDKHYKKHLFNIYINTLSIYDSHEQFGLNEIVENVDVFYYDCLNSTFYATDDQIEALLDALCEWKDKACKKVKEFNKKKEIEDLKTKLEKLTA